MSRDCNHVIVMTNHVISEFLQADGHHKQDTICWHSGLCQHTHYDHPGIL